MCERKHRQSVLACGPLAAGPRRQPVQPRQGHHSHATYAPAMEPRLWTIQGRGEACHHRRHRTLHQHTPPGPPHTNIPHQDLLTQTYPTRTSSHQHTPPGPPHTNIPHQDLLTQTYPTRTSSRNSGSISTACHKLTSHRQSE